MALISFINELNDFGITTANNIIHKMKCNRSANFRRKSSDSLEYSRAIQNAYSTPSMCQRINRLLHLIYSLLWAFLREKFSDEISESIVSFGRLYRIKATSRKLTKMFVFVVDWINVFKYCRKTTFFGICF